MDVQGAEIDVFRGGMNTLSKTRFIYTEYDNNELYKGQFNLRQLMKYLKDLDFSFLIRYPGDVLFGNKQFAGSSKIAPADPE
jgi:2-O-methyltransferase